MLLMLRVDVESVLRSEEGEEEREDEVERWKDGGWRERGVRPKGRDMFGLEERVGGSVGWEDVWRYLW